MSRREAYNELHEALNRVKDAQEELDERDSLEASVIEDLNGVKRSVESCKESLKSKEQKDMREFA